MRDLEEISGDVLDVALRLHRELGPGLLESVYETIMAAKLAALGYSVDVSGQWISNSKECGLTLRSEST